MAKDGKLTSFPRYFGLITIKSDRTKKTSLGWNGESTQCKTGLRINSISPEVGQFLMLGRTIPGVRLPLPSIKNCLTSFEINCQIHTGCFRHFTLRLVFLVRVTYSIIYCIWFGAVFFCAEFCVLSHISVKAAVIRCNQTTYFAKTMNCIADNSASTSNLPYFQPESTSRQFSTRYKTDLTCFIKLKKT
jgi:hypothetical protein